MGIEETASETSFGSLFSREQSILSDNDSYMSAQRRETLKSINTDYVQKSDARSTLMSVDENGQKKLKVVEVVKMGMANPRGLV